MGLRQPHKTTITYLNQYNVTLACSMVGGLNSASKESGLKSSTLCKNCSGHACDNNPETELQEEEADGDVE